jgi:hypothetical protein
LLNIDRLAINVEQTSKLARILARLKPRPFKALQADPPSSAGFYGLFTGWLCRLKEGSKIAQIV